MHQGELGEPAPADLRWVLEASDAVPHASSESGIPVQVVSLGGGADAQTFLVRRAGHDLVVKLSDRGLEAEARALRAWKGTTDCVPDVLDVGTVPTPGGRTVTYLVLAALLDDDGEVVKTAAEHLLRSPAAAREVGRELGAVLGHMHEARCGSSFGNFADSPGAERAYGTWGAYLEEFFMQHADHVRGLGVAEPRIDAVRAFIGGCRYVREPRCLHGDVSIRNIAMCSNDPVRIALFDPNPLSGDPSWDIAPMVNNVEFNERRSRVDAGSSATLRRDRDLLAGFRASYPGVVGEDALLSAQLVQAVLQAEHRERAVDQAEADDLGVAVTHDFIRDVVDRMSA